MVKIVFSKKELKYINSLDDETRSSVLFIIKSGMLAELIKKLEKKHKGV